MYGQSTLYARPVPHLKNPVPDLENRSGVGSALEEPVTMPEEHTDCVCKVSHEACWRNDELRSDLLWELRKALENAKINPCIREAIWERVMHWTHMDDQYAGASEGRVRKVCKGEVPMDLPHS